MQKVPFQRYSTAVIAVFSVVNMNMNIARIYSVDIFKQIFVSLTVACILNFVKVLLNSCSKF